MSLATRVVCLQVIERDRIQLCGPLAASLNGIDLSLSIRGTQSRIVFAYLVLARTRQVDRDELAEALWGTAPPPEPAVALRALVSKLRTALKATGAAELSSGDLLRLELPRGVWVDVEAAVQSLHDAQSAVAQKQEIRAWIASHIALNVSSRTFLEGASGSWVAERRAALLEMRLRALEALSASALRIGGPELDTAQRAARELTRLAPYRETGHGHLIRALASQGNRAEAVLTYDALRVRLREELGMSPSPELQALHRELLDAGPDT